MDMGKTWTVVHEFVKAFYWTSERPKSLIIERAEAMGRNTVINLGTVNHWTARNYARVITGVEDFQIRGDYMFATKKPWKVRQFSLGSSSTMYLHIRIFQT